MPDSLEGALGEAAERAVASRAGRVLAEVYVPELFDPFSGGILANEGDQQRYWDMGDVFCRQALAKLPEGPVNFVYTDVGTSARMAQAWADSPQVHVSSLCDRTIAREGDVATVVVCADPMAARAIPDLAQVMADSAGAIGGQLILFNPVFNNYEVGAGLTARRLREAFLSTFHTAYSLRPFNGGACLKVDPAPWKVFVDDPEKEGRYLLLQEAADRPAGDDLEYLLMEFDMKQSGLDLDESPYGKLMKFGRSMQRFMRQIGTF